MRQRFAAGDLQELRARDAARRGDRIGKPLFKIDE